MTTLGIGLIVFTICFSLLIIIVLPFLKVKRYSYYIYLVINLAWLIYFLATRWGPYIKNLIDSGGIQYLKDNWSFLNPANYSVYVSKALLLDMCPFLGLVLPITIIFDRKWCSLKMSVCLLLLVD